MTLGVIFPKEDGVLCGVDIARMVFAEIDSSIKFEGQLRDGDEFTPGLTIASVIGPAAGCLKGERTALNILQHLSGIATLTRQFVSAAKGRVKVMDTRKTLPGLRVMEKYAVRTGGGVNHRFGLFDMVLIKDNHIQIAGSITNAVNAARKRGKGVFIEVEVKTMDEVREAAGLDIQRIMIDNMNPERIRQAVQIVRQSGKKVEIEVSGGVNLDNIGDLADADVDFVSAGALTHSARAIDIALKMKPLGKSD
jgi:nicotinate-nucleotide pyrophosphorylase (carboxylating)